MARPLRPLAGLVVALVLHRALLEPAEAYYDREAFRDIVYNDNTNDDAIYLTTQELIVRSGFNYTTYYSVAADGYVTQIFRLDNPLADRRQLKRPPIAIYHGASIDQSAYLVASSRQHHPERYPRAPGDGPITSSNRSLGFYLANNGYEVYLVGTRGSNRGNQGYVTNVTEARANYATFRLGAQHYQFVDTQREAYFLYGLDDVIAYEIEEQLRRVLEVSNSSELSVFSYSLSTPTTMAFLAARPDYARRVRCYFQQAPAIAADHFTAFSTAFFEVLDPTRPAAGEGFLAVPYGQLILRGSIITLSLTPQTKYTTTYTLMTQLFGPSQLYHTNLELNVLAHIFQDVSHKTIQQYSQNSLSKKLTFYDYGPLGNLARYGQLKPPEYNISRLEVQRYVVIDGSYDALADQTTVQRLIEKTSVAGPVVHITAPGFNHLDFIAAVENVRYVNSPILRQLEITRDR